jgi:hypothetical protein
MAYWRSWARSLDLVEYRSEEADLLAHLIPLEACQSLLLLLFEMQLFVLVSFPRRYQLGVEW